MLPLTHRIRKAKEYQEHKKHAHYFHGHVIMIFARPSGTPRLGLVVSKKVSKRAIDRNRIKRLIRAWFYLEMVKPNVLLDVVAVAKPGCLNWNHQQMIEQLNLAKYKMIRFLSNCSKETDG